MRISVFDMGTCSYGYFSQDYRTPSKKGEKVANHLGMDFTYAVGTEIISHVDGTCLFANNEATNWNSYCFIWNGSYTHIFGHIEPKVSKDGAVKAGDVIGVIKSFPDGTTSHLHYGVNRNKIADFGHADKSGKWGWGRCPVDKTTSDADKYGWSDPRMVLASMALAKGKIYSVKLKHK